MGEKSELSMSVQSAWEDLIVENPNRRKLEACLVTTIMIVVVCIMGLLLFVVIELQPANNLKRVARRPNVEDCSNGTCPEFGHRVLGWINFHGKPCVDFHQWVCHGRLTDSPEDTFMQTAERAGTFAANAEFYNLFMRNYAYETTKNNVHPKALTYMWNLYEICMSGLGQNDKDKDYLDVFLKETLWKGAVRGIAGAAEASAFHEYHVIMMKQFNFHPFGRMLKSGGNYVVMPMNLLGTVEQIKLAGFKTEFQEGFAAIAAAFDIGKADDTSRAYAVEEKLAEAMKSKVIDADFPSTRPLAGFKDGPNLNLANILKDVFDDSSAGKIGGRHPNTGAALAAYDAGGANAMNLATFKILLWLSLFANEDNPKLGPFFAFANKYQWGSKVLPVKVYRCGTFIENYMKPAIMHFISEYDKGRLEAIKTDTMKVLEDLSATTGDKKAVSPFVSVLTNAKSKIAELGNDLKALQFFYLTDVKAHSDGYFACSAELPDWDHNAAGGFLTHINHLSEKFACNYKIEAFQKQHGFPVLGSEPYYDFVSETTYIPYGFTFPPNYHPFVRGISFHHYAPGFYFRIIGEAFKAAILRNASIGGNKGQWKAESAEIEKAIKCFQNEIKTPQNKSGALQIMADSLALPVAYKVYRYLLNHAAWDVKKQARVALIPMFTEGQFFFIQAAQTRCEYWDPDPKITFPRELSGATPADKVNLVFSKSNQLFANRFGCAKARPMSAKAPVCKLPVQILKKDTEKEYPGVYV